MTLKDILKTTAIFKSTIWADTVDMIRAHLDPVDAQELYTFNSVDEYINMEFGDWEVVPDLHEDDTLDAAELQRRVDTVIGANRDYWTRFVESLEATFNPLYNVDAYETTITEYGSHLRTDAHGAQTDTMQYGQRQTTTQYGQQEITAGQRQDTHVNGAQSITHSETTMDSLTFKAKTKDDHATYTDTDTMGSQTTTSGQHSDSFTQQQATDTTGRAAYTDTSTSGEHTDTETIRRYGNIGVTKSTELLADFQEFARRSKIVPVIAVEISKALTFSVWY